MRTLTGIGLFFFGLTWMWAQEKPEQKTSVVFQDKTPRDTVQYKTPAYRQGVICNFEDHLNRKKVPINFQLGNSKY